MAELFQLECSEEKNMQPATDTAIRALLCECFPTDKETFSKTRYWHGTGPVYSLIYWKDRKALGHVGVVLRAILCGNRSVSIAGIQSLAVSPTVRGSGLAQQLMIEAMSEATRRGVGFGLLFCVPGLERFYVSLEWITTRRESVMTMNGVRQAIPAKNIVMYKLLGTAPFPDGDIDLQGADW